MSVHEKMTAIADAIREKTGGTETLNLDEMAEAIGNFADTSGATATADDLAEGVTAFVNGEKITGTVPVKNESAGGVAAYDMARQCKASSVYSMIYVSGKANEDVMVKKDSYIRTTIDAGEFGDATAADVREGKTFTSASGLKITGTMIISMDEIPPVAE